MKKRGQSLLWTLAELIFAAILILFIMWVFGVFDIGAGTIEAQASASTYNNIIKTVKNMTASPEYLKIAVFPAPVEQYASIVAFNKEEDFSADACDPVENVQKPPICGDDACMCYYNPGYNEDFADNKLGKQPCVRFPEVDDFITFYYSDWNYETYFKSTFWDAGSDIQNYYGADSTVYKNIAGDEIKKDLQLPSYYPKGHCAGGKCAGYAYFFLYGECDGWYADQEFGRHDLYIEKFTNPENEKTYIFIAADSGKESIKQRRGILQSEIDRIVKKTPADFLTLINQSYEKKDFKSLKKYATFYKIYYEKEPSNANTTIEVNRYLALATEQSIT